LHYQVLFEQRLSQNTYLYFLVPLIGLTGTTLTGTGTTNAKITSSAILSSGRNIDLSGLYYFDVAMLGMTS
jgi:hypothetical protein